jgi:hypothetical protein
LTQSKTDDECDTKDNDGFYYRWNCSYTTQKQLNNDDGCIMEQVDIIGVQRKFLMGF